MYAHSILKSHNGLPWKQCNFTITNQFIIEEHNVLPLSDLIEPFDMNKKWSLLSFTKFHLLSFH